MGRSAYRDRFVALDFELANRDLRSICAIGAVGVVNARVVWELSVTVRPEPSHVTLAQVHGFNWTELRNAPTFRETWPHVLEYFRPFETWVAHNAAFERSVLRAACEAWRLDRPLVEWVCTMSLTERHLGGSMRALDKACRHLDIVLEHHSPLSDARAAASLAIRLSERPGP